MNLYKQQQIKEYSDERIFNTLKQSYNFDPEIINFVKQEAVARGLLSNNEVDLIIHENEKLRSEIADQNYRELQDLRMNKLSGGEENDSGSKEWIAYLIIAGICILLYFFTGALITFIPGALVGMGYSYNKRSGIFSGRFRR